MDSNVKHLHMVDVHSLMRQLRVRLGDMRANNWSEIQFSVDYITGISAIVEYKVDTQTRSLSVSVSGRFDAIGTEIPSATISINGNDTYDADKLPDIAFGLIVSNIYPQYLLVDSTYVAKTIYDDEHYPYAPINTTGTLGK